jgi:hypothetical protein
MDDIENRRLDYDQKYMNLSINTIPSAPPVRLVRNLLLCIFITLLLHINSQNKLVQSSQSDSNSISVCLQSFPLGKCDDCWTQFPKTVGGEFLGCNVLLEREGVDSGELSSETVCGKSVVGSRGVVSTSARQYPFRTKIGRVSCR